MSNSFPLKGLRQLDGYLAALPKNMQKGAYRSGLNAGARQIADEAKLRAKGKIANAITVGSPRQNQDGTFSIRIYVDVRKDDGYLGVFQEWGVSPHLIARTSAGQGRVAVRKAKAGKGTVERRAMKIGGDFVSGIISHPGHAANPFFLPSLDAKAKHAVEAFADQIVEYLYNKTSFDASVGLRGAS